MSGFINRFFPEKIFSHKIDPGAERRLRLAQALYDYTLAMARLQRAIGRP